MLTFDEIFRNHSARIYNVCRRILLNDADAEDATQNALLAIYRNLDSFRGEAELTTWLHTVAKNSALHVRSKRIKRQEREKACWMVDIDRETPVDTLQAAEQASVVEQAIAGLPDLYREAYSLSELDCWSNERIGNRLGISLAAVKSRLHRARLIMRTALTTHFAAA